MESLIKSITPTMLEMTFKEEEECEKNIARIISVVKKLENDPMISKDNYAKLEKAKKDLNREYERMEKIKAKFKGIERIMS